LKKIVTTQMFDPDILRGIEKMDHSEARSQCITLIEATSTRDKKKQALLRDIDKAPNSRELSRIMWNVMLAGEGLASITSNWGR
jgi:hypothetical protein